MTHIALRELRQHPCGMRSAVAGFAGRDIFMLFFMAGNTCQSRVFRACGGECIENALMAGSALVAGRIRTERDRQGLVGRMTDRAVLVRLLCRMGLVTLHARRNVSVRFVAGSAEQLRMARRNILQLLALGRMAGEARGCKIRRQFHFQGRMRVRMARFAAPDLEVRFACVAVGADRDDLIFAHHGGMAFMAIQAADSRLMPGALAVHYTLNCRMTLYAVGIRKLRLIGKTLMKDKTVRHNHGHNNYR